MIEEAIESPAQVATPVTPLVKPSIRPTGAKGVNKKTTPTIPTVAFTDLTELTPISCYFKSTINTSSHFNKF